MLFLQLLASPRQIPKRNSLCRTETAPFWEVRRQPFSSLVNALFSSFPSSSSWRSYKLSTSRNTDSLKWAKVGHEIQDIWLVVLHSHRSQVLVKTRIQTTIKKGLFGHPKQMVDVSISIFLYIIRLFAWNESLSFSRHTVYVWFDLVCKHRGKRWNCTESGIRETMVVGIFHFCLNIVGYQYLYLA